MSPWLWALTLCVLFFLLLRLLMVATNLAALSLAKNPSISKIFILGAEGAAGFAFAQFASVMRSYTVSLVLGVILFVGSKLRAHLKRRTTASYSTSDLYHQRLFNLSILFQIFGLSLGVLLDVCGVSMPRIMRIPFFVLPSVSVMWLLTLAALTEIFRNGFTLAANSRTLLYLFGNYWKGLREGSMKRF